MKITGIMPIKNGIAGGFPFIEGILSVLPVVDEFLVVDGGSSDDTWEVLNRLQKSFPEKVEIFQDTWIPSPNCENIDGSLNRLVLQAKGDWIINILGDEIWHEKDVLSLKKLIAEADGSGYKGIRTGMVEAIWDSFNRSYCRGSTYKTIRIFKKQSNLRLFRVGDDVFVDPVRSIREGFTSSNLPPELDSSFEFYHFHRLFSENTPAADKLMNEELASGERAGVFYTNKFVGNGSTHSDLPEIMKGLAYKSRYLVRDELFDVGWLRRVTGLQYGDAFTTKEGEMELLPNFNLDGFCRQIWLNKRAKEKWSSVLPEAASLLQSLEVESVVRGQRPCSWQTIGEEDHPRFQREWTSKGLVSAIIRRVGQFQGFTNQHYPVREGEPALVCCILSKSVDDLEAFRKAVVEEDDYAQGILLGYPECCCRFFRDVWLKGYHDPIWQAALNSSVTCEDSHYIRMRTHEFSNPVLRFLGIRLAFHIPCSFDCQKTIEIAKERLEMARETNPELAEKIVQLLGMPASWDCYHGIAMVRTPMVYAVVPSCGSVERFVIDFEGDYIPPEAERGLVYPNILVKSESES